MDTYSKSPLLQNDFLPARCPDGHNRTLTPNEGAPVRLRLRRRPNASCATAILEYQTQAGKRIVRDRIEAGRPLILEGFDRPVSALLFEQ